MTVEATLASCFISAFRARAPERGRRVWTQSTIWPLARARSRRWSGVIERSGICHVSRQHCRRCGLLASAALLLEADRRQEERRRAEADHPVAAAFDEAASLLEQERRPAEADRPAAAGSHQESRPAVARRLTAARAARC